MVLPALLGLVLVGLVLGAFGWRRWRVAAMVLALVGVILAGCGTLPNLLLRGWQQPYAHRPVIDWAPVNVIVLLTATSTNPPAGTPEPGNVGWARVAEAAALYHDCHAAPRRCTVLVTGGDTPTSDRPLAVAYADSLQGLGVARADLVLESRSRTTWQNAEFTQPLLVRLHAGRVVMVSSALHLRRAMFVFRHFGVDPVPVRADYTRVAWSVLPSAANLALTDRALHEYLGMAWYRWKAWRHPSAAP